MANAADEARSLADLFGETSKAVDEYRARHLNELTPEQRTQLEQLIQKIDDAHDECTADAIEDTINQVQTSLQQIASVTGQAQQALKHLNTVQQVVNIASAVSELAQAIMTADYGGIPSALVNLGQTISKKADAAAGTAGVSE
jgi:ABC-type transporter Mla subunit MlaD